MFVERPPMSQRSHIAQSGSSAIIECSAACSVEISVGICSSPSSCRAVGTYQTASVSNDGRRQVELDRRDRRLVADALALVGDDVLRDGDACRT